MTMETDKVRRNWQTENNEVWTKLNNCITLAMWYSPTSTIVILAALHMGWLKFLAVFLLKKVHT